MTILKENGHINIANEIGKKCLKHAPAWANALKCFDQFFLAVYGGVMPGNEYRL